MVNPSALNVADDCIEIVRLHEFLVLLVVEGLR